MNSGEWITLFLFGGVSILLAAFIPWELIQLYRRRNGNASARTLSQYVIKRAKEGSKFWRVVIVAFPVFLMVVGLWLLFHWEGLQFIF